ncbi:MAG TPA: ABC transporter substrate-binding protein, partial [Vicinamibacterales bacterium]
AVGAGPRVVGVSSYDTYPAAVKTLPSVGALLDPDVERILSLKPDLVIVYASQTDLRQQLGRAGIHVYEYRHEGLADVMTTIVSLGERVGEDAPARALATELQRGLDGIQRKVAGRQRPRTLLVFGRERLSLRGIYASGGVGFLNDMLAIAGGANVFADIKEQNVQASIEQILAAKPEVILEVRAANEAWPEGSRDAELRVWDALPSVPAVRDHRIVFLADDRIVIPGPRVVEGTRLIAKALHPDAFARAGSEGARGSEGSGSAGAVVRRSWFVVRPVFRRDTGTNSERRTLETGTSRPSGTRS